MVSPQKRAPRDPTVGLGAEWRGTRGERGITVSTSAVSSALSAASMSCTSGPPERIVDDLAAFVDPTEVCAAKMTSKRRRSDAAAHREAPKTFLMA